MFRHLGMGFSKLCPHFCLIRYRIAWDLSITEWLFSYVGPHFDTECHFYISSHICSVFTMGNSIGLQKTDQALTVLPKISQAISTDELFDRGVDI